MHSDIYSKPEFLTNVRYRKNEQGDTAVWEVREENIYDKPDDVADYSTDPPTQDGGQESQKQPGLKKGPFRCATLCLGVLCTGMIAVIIFLSTYTHWVKRRNNELMNSCDYYCRDCLREYHRLDEDYSQLQVRYDQLRGSRDQLKANNSQLQDELNQLKENIEGKWCPEGWRRFGCSCYYKSTEKKTWSESRSFCQERGADLVIINSKEEQEFISELNMNGDSWIGLKPEVSAPPQESEWKWVDRSPLTTTFWAAGWPQHQDQRYAAVCCDGEGNWTESSDDDNKNWICEK